MGEGRGILHRAQSGDTFRLVLGRACPLLHLLTHAPPLPIAGRSYITITGEAVDAEIYQADGSVGSMVSHDSWSVPNAVRVDADGAGEWLVWRFNPPLDPLGTSDLRKLPPRVWQSPAIVRRFYRLHDAPTAAFVEFARIYGVFCICAAHGTPGRAGDGHRDQRYPPLIPTLWAGGDACPIRVVDGWFAEPLATVAAVVKRVARRAPVHCGAGNR